LTEENPVPPSGPAISAAVDLPAVKQLLVVPCHNGPVVYTKTAMSLMQLGWGNRIADAKAAHGFDAIDLFWSTNWPRVDLLRDQAIVFARSEGFSHVLFLDADMTWPHDVLKQMLRHADRRAIVSGLYFMRGGPHAPVAMGDKFRQDGSQVDHFAFRDLTSTREDGLIACDVVGMGCCLIPLAVFEAIGDRPWFFYKDDDEGWPRVTEDVPFCLAVRTAGWEVLLDPSVECGHLELVARNRGFYEGYKLAQQARPTIDVQFPTPVAIGGAV
jgi:hypothetical protein